MTTQRFLLAVKIKGNKGNKIYQTHPLKNIDAAWEHARKLEQEAKEKGIEVKCLAVGYELSPEEVAVRDAISKAEKLNKKSKKIRTVH